MSPTDRNAVVTEYRKLASDYDQRWSFYIEATARETLSRLELRPWESLLDVGCGTGALLEALAASVPGAKLSGVDPSPDILEVSSVRQNSEQIQLVGVLGHVFRERGIRKQLNQRFFFERRDA